jgi:hypothetical protein
MALVQVLYQVLPFSPVITHPQMLIIHAVLRIVIIVKS